MLDTGYWILDAGYLMLVEEPVFSETDPGPKERFYTPLELIGSQKIVQGYLSGALPTRRGMSR